MTNYHLALLSSLLLLLAACNLTENGQKQFVSAYDLPEFPKEKAERNFRMKVNPYTGEVPADGAWKAIQELKANGKLQTSNSYKRKAGESGGWIPVNEFLESMAVTWITYDPNNPDIYYFCTGEGWFNADAVRGAGVWKSEDQGETWTLLEQTATNEDFYWCQKIGVHPITSDVYVATQDGLYRSQDQGENWEVILNVDLGSFRSSFCDLEFTSDGGIYVTGGIFETGRIYYSDSGDIGTWQHQLNGLPEFGVYRIEMAVAPSDPDIAYAILGDTESNDYMIEGVFKTTDKGQTWAEINNPGGDYNLARRQSWYDLSLAVDPNNPDVVVAGGLHIWRSQDGGDNWQQLTHGKIDSLGYQYTHVDQHRVVFQSSDTVFFANDGGIHVSTDFTEEEPVIYNRNYGYNVTQYYAAAMFPEAGDPRIFGGTQDNGTYISSSDGISSFNLLTWADGGFCDHSILEPDVVYTTSQLNKIFRVNTATGQIDSISNPYRTNDDVQFINPLAVDPANPSNLYMGTTRGIYRLANATVADSSQWTRACATPTGDVTALAFAESKPNTMFIGRENFSSVAQPVKIYRLENCDTTTEATTFTDADPQNYLPTASIINTSSIHVDRSNENHVLVTYSNYGVNKIWESFNALDQVPVWHPITGDLPDIPVYSIVLHPENNDKAYIGTEIGVFYTENIDSTSTVWQPLNNGLGLIRTDMLRVRNSDYTLLAATHGRGLFTAQMDPTGMDMAIQFDERGPDNIGGRTRAFMIDPNVSSKRKIWAGSVSGGLWYTDDIFDLGDEIVSISENEEIGNHHWQVFPNPVGNEGAQISFELNQFYDDISIEIWSPSGKFIQSVYKGSLTQGSHQLNWKPLNDLSKGHYLVVFSDGRRTSSKSIIYL